MQRSFPLIVTCSPEEAKEVAIQLSSHSHRSIECRVNVPISLPEGLYRLVVRKNGAVDQRIIRHLAPTSIDVPGVRFKIPELQDEALQFMCRVCNEERVSAKSQFNRMYLFVRSRSKPKSIRFSESLSQTSNMRLLARQDNWFAFSKSAIPNPHYWVSINERVAVPLISIDGWKSVHVFDSDDFRPRTLAVFLLPSGEYFTEDSPSLNLQKNLQSALAHEDRNFPFDEVVRLGKNPLLAVLACLLMDALDLRATRSYLHLQKFVLQFSRGWTDAKFFMPGIKKKYDSPATLRTIHDCLVSESLNAPEVIEKSSLADLTVTRLLVNGVWTAWLPRKNSHENWDLPWLKEAVADKRIGTESEINQLASRLGLTVWSVIRAIDQGPAQV